MEALRVEGLTVSYGRVEALRDLTFSAAPGEPVVILGRNGAGKSTALAAIAGAVHAARGGVWLGDRDVSGLPPDERARLGMALVPEGKRLFPHLTVRENLQLGGFLLDPPTLEAALDRAASLFPVLRARSDSPAGELSGGEQQMLAIGRALVAEPRVLLLDEPSLGLAPMAIGEVYDRLAQLRDEGLTIVLVEQQVGRALGFAKESIVLNLGRVVAHEESHQLAHDPRLLRAYLGSHPGSPTGVADPVNRAPGAGTPPSEHG